MAGALKAIVVSAPLALSFSTPTVAGPFEDGSAAYDRNDYSTAMRHWRIKETPRPNPISR
jgi:hypothetical protein